LGVFQIHHSEGIKAVNLVTGATGLLGSHIVEQLIRRGKPVRALVRPSSDTSWLLRQRGVELVQGDVTDPASLRAAMDGADCVYHAAARVGDWGPWSEFVSISVEGTRNVLAAARQAGVQRIIHISSISVYGHPDGEGLVLDETAPSGVRVHRWSYYTRAKVEAEKIAWDYYKKYQMPITVIRPSWLYGPRDRATLPRMARLLRQGKMKLVGPGDNKLNVVYAGNVAEACLLAAEKDAAIGQLYNCCNDGPITQKQFLDLLAAELGAPPVTRSVPYNVAWYGAFVMECFGHLFRTKNPPMATRYAVWLIGRRCYFSAEKARRELGWQSTVDYAEGVKRAVAWLRAQQAASAEAAS